MILIHMMLYNTYMWCQKRGVKYGFGVFLPYRIAKGHTFLKLLAETGDNIWCYGIREVYSLN